MIPKAINKIKKIQRSKNNGTNAGYINRYVHNYSPWETVNTTISKKNKMQKCG